MVSKHLQKKGGLKAATLGKRTAGATDPQRVM
jgi:hypothetical protein